MRPWARQRGGKLEGDRESEHPRQPRSPARGLEGASFFKGKAKGTRKGKERRRTPGLASGRGDKSRAGCSQAHPGVRGLALLFIRIYSHSSVYIPGEKKVEPGNKNFFLSVFIACLGLGEMSRNVWGCSLPPPHPPPPRKKGKRENLCSCNCFNLKAVLGASVGKH